MTLKNILPIACFLFAAVSCSMEDDLMPATDMGKANNNVPALSGETALSFQVNIPGSLATKADDNTVGLTADEKNINRASLILLDGSNNVIKAYDNVRVNATNGIAEFGKVEDDTIKFIVKTSDVKNYRMMVVANSAQNFAACKTIEAVKNTLQGKSEYSKYAGVNDIVKVGTSEAFSNTDIYAAGFTGYPTIKEATENAPFIVQVKLTQLEARIELAAFNVTKYTDNSAPVELKITKVELLNINTNSDTNKDTNTKFESFTDNKAYTGGLSVRPATTASNVASSFDFTSEGHNANMPVFYSFANVTSNVDNQVKMRIHFTLSDKDGNVLNEITSRDIIINGGEVKAGHLYRLTVNSAIANDNIEIDIVCDTKDWIYNYLTVNMLDVR